MSDGAKTQRRRASEVEIEWLLARLEEAGATLLALPSRGRGPALRQVRWPETAGEGGDQASGNHRIRPPSPGAAEISRMDEAFSWIGLIADDRVMLRRIAHARALVSPLTSRHIYSWRKLGLLLGADHKAVQRWHRDALEAILDQLRKIGKIACNHPHNRLII